MFTLQILTIISIIIIIILFTTIISINKITIDNINNQIKLSDNIKNLRILLWLNYTITMLITMYLMYRVFSKIDISFNLTVFVANIIAIVLNTILNMGAELMLQDTSQDKLNNIYVTSTISTIINILNIILLLYVYNDVLDYNPRNLRERLLNSYI